MNTAKRVLKRFWVNKDLREDKATMTEKEQISLFKEYYEGQIDAMMDREIDIKKDLTLAMHKIDMQKNRIEMQEKKIAEQKDAIAKLDDKINEQMVQMSNYEDELKAKDREKRIMAMKFED